MPPSNLSLIGIARHLTDVELNYFRRRWGGQEIASYYASADRPDADFEDASPATAEAWAEGTTDDPTIVNIGENGQVQMDIGAARMLIRGPDRYPFDPVVSALILRALVTRVPQAALDLPEPIDDDELINVLMTCISRGFFGA